jgi:DNA polymerase
VLDTFRGGKDLYCETASKMFGVPVVKNGENGHLRQKGKIAVLALGYGGGVSALEAMGGKRMGLEEEEEKEIVRLWRASNKGITKFWALIEAACISAINTRTPVTLNKGIEVSSRWSSLLIKLPSGRYLCYPRAKVGYDERVEKDNIVYEGMNQTTKKWEEVRTYGGKLTENIVQAIARDILAWVILRAQKQGIDIVFHVHDEVVAEADASVSLQQIENLFNTPISWCKDLPLKGVGYTTKYYLKD